MFTNDSLFLFFFFPPMWISFVVPLWPYWTHPTHQAFHGRIASLSWLCSAFGGMTPCHGLALKAMQIMRNVTGEQKWSSLHLLVQPSHYVRQPSCLVCFVGKHGRQSQKQILGCDIQLCHNSHNPYCPWCQEWQFARVQRRISKSPAPLQQEQHGHSRVSMIMDKFG